MVQSGVSVFKRYTMGEKSKLMPLFKILLGKGFCNDSFLNSIPKRISMLCEDFFETYGIEVPTVNILSDDKNDHKLEEMEYAICVSGTIVKRFVCEKDCTIVLETEDIVIPQHEVILLNNLSEIIERNLKSIITTQYVKELLDEIKQKNKALVKNLQTKYKEKLHFTIKSVLASLLEEQVSIKDIVPILEVIYDSEDEELPLLVEHARQTQAHAIISQFLDANNQLNIIELSHKTMEFIATQQKNWSLISEPEFYNDFISKTSEAIKNAKDRNSEAVLVVSFDIRKAVKKLLKLSMPRIPVLSIDEVLIANEKLPNLKINRIRECINVEDSFLKEEKQNITENKSSDDNKILEKIKNSDILIMSEKNNIAIGLYYDGNKMKSPEITLITNEWEQKKKLIGDNVVTTLNSSPLAKYLFQEYKEGEHIQEGLFKTVAVIYSKLVAYSSRIKNSLTTI